MKRSITLSVVLQEYVLHYFHGDINLRGSISQCHELFVVCSWQCLLSISILQIIRVLSGLIATVYLDPFLGSGSVAAVASACSFKVVFQALCGVNYNPGFGASSRLCGKYLELSSITRLALNKW